MDVKTSAALDDRLVTVKEASRQANVTSTSIYNWRRKGHVHCYRMDSRYQLLFEEFHSWLKTWLSRTKRRGPLTLGERMRQQTISPCESTMKPIGVNG
jgi:hypothetical protein